MATKPTLRDVWFTLYQQGAVGAPVQHTDAARKDPLQAKREWLAQQLANVVMHKAMRVKA